METPKESLNPQILAEASEWLVEFETGGGGADARREFDDWLRRSPEHVRAYLGLLPIWKQGTVGHFTRDRGPESLIAYARTEGNVVPLAVGERIGKSRATRFRLRLSIAAAALLAISGAVFVWRGIAEPSYATGIGEQRSVLLPDGSTLELNARSQARVRFTEQRRSIELLEGQALFHVAPDPRRPFVVDIGTLRVRAVGTRFDVNKRTSGTIVTVVEGRVSLLPAALAQGVERRDERSILSAGEQVTVNSVTARQTLRPRRANLAAITAWTQRRLVFDAASLTEVVEEFNRYNTRPLSIVDPALERFPITGSFSSTNPASLIRFLEVQPGILVVAAEDEIRIGTRR